MSIGADSVPTPDVTRRLAASLREPQIRGLRAAAVYQWRTVHFATKKSLIKMDYVTSDGMITTLGIAVLRVRMPRFCYKQFGPQQTATTQEESPQ